MPVNKGLQQEQKCFALFSATIDATHPPRQAILCARSPMSFPPQAGGPALGCATAAVQLSEHRRQIAALGVDPTFARGIIDGA
jgi:hypothetical protein